MDYSHGVLGSLDESALDEAAGVSPGLPAPFDHYLVQFVNPAISSVTRFGSTYPGTTIDWNGDTIIQDATSPVSVDLNNDGVLDVMRGAEDWSHLFHAFQCQPTFSD